MLAANESGVQGPLLPSVASTTPPFDQEDFPGTDERFYVPEHRDHASSSPAFPYRGIHFSLCLAIRPADFTAAPGAVNAIRDADRDSMSFAHTYS